MFSAWGIKETISVAFSPKANYTDWSTAIVRRIFGMGISEQNIKNYNI
jgi:hypothetical protein